MTSKPEMEGDNRKTKYINKYYCLCSTCRGTGKQLIDRGAKWEVTEIDCDCCKGTTGHQHSGICEELKIQLLIDLNRIRDRIDRINK